MYQEIKLAFDKQDIEIPFPHMSLYAGTASKPLPVSLHETQVSAENTSQK